MALQTTVVTVKRNWKKKIEAICKDVETITSYSLGSNFEGVQMDINKDDGWLDHFVKKEVNGRSVLRYNKENGHAVLHIHSNQWYEWENKIKW